MAERAQNITDPHPIRNISNNILLGTLSSYACEKSINVTYQVTFFLGGISRNNRNDTTICSRQPLFSCAPASSRYGINHSINLEHSAIPYSFAREFILIPREFRALDLSPFLNIANNFALAQDTLPRKCFFFIFFSFHGNMCVSYGAINTVCGPG